jgi:cytochrome P450
LQELQRTYGDMATIYLARTPIVILFRPEYVRYVLVENPRNFTNREFAGMGGSALDEGLLTIDGEKHRQQRRAVQPAFHKKRVESYASMMTQYTGELLQTWHAGDTVDVSKAMQELTLRVVGKCLFNIDLNTQLQEIGSAFNEMLGSQVGILEALLNMQVDNPITSYGRRMSAIRKLDMLINTLIAQRRADPGDKGDVLSMLLAAPEGETPDMVLNDKQVHDHIMTFIAAGHETTANALTWTFYLLAAHPSVREKLLDELRSVLGNRPPTLEDMSKLTYTDWVLNESMRLYPPAWLQGRHAVEAFDLGDHRLPADTLIMLSQWVMHRLPDVWGDPETFRPERWDPANEQKVPSGAYFPFGMGPRICIGMPFAQLEAKLILTTIMQHYSPRTLKGYEPGVNPLITLRPKNPLKMVLIPTPTNASDTSANNAWQQTMRTPYDSQNGSSERQGCLGALMNLLNVVRL